MVQARPAVIHLSANASSKHHIGDDLGREWDTIKPVRDQPLRQVPQVVFFTVPKQSIGRQPAQRDTATSVSSSQAHRSDKTSRSTGSRAACPVFAAKGRRGRRPHQEDAKTACPNLCKVMLPKADVQLPDKLPYRIADTLQESCPDSPSSSAPTSSTINRSSVQDLHLFAVYDGHAGPHASSHCSERLHHHFCSALSAICPTWVSSGNSQHRDSDPGTPSSRSSSSGSESSFQLSRADTLAWLDDDILDDWPMLAGGSWHPERGRSRLPFRAIRSSSHGSMALKDAQCSRRRDQDAVPCLVESALRAAFQVTDEEFGDMCERAGLTGCTAVVAVVGRTHLWVANCGDSRAVLCRGGRALQLSDDHKPNRPDEMDRVTLLGGEVVHRAGWRVQGKLAMSRAIGDHCLRPYVIAEPEVTRLCRSEEDELLLLASDGLWDVLSSEDAVALALRTLRSARQRGASRQAAAQIAASVVTRAAIEIGSRDNVTAMLIDLSPGGDDSGR